jgi:hypothetical protein
LNVEQLGGVVGRKVHRILFTDLLACTERQHAGHRAALDRMTEGASEAGTYGGTPEDYAAAPQGSPQFSGLRTVLKLFEHLLRNLPSGYEPADNLISP